MITEKGTVKLLTKVDESLYVEITKNLKLLSISYLILGPLLALIGVICKIIADVDFVVTFILICGVLFTILGIVFLIARNKSVNHAKQWNIANEYEFFSDRIDACQYVNGEIVGNEKIYLSWIVNAKEAKNVFSFGSRKNIGSALYYISKEGATEYELNIVRALLRLPLSPTAQIPPYPDPFGQTAVPPAENAHPNEPNSEQKPESEIKDQTNDKT